MQTPQQLAYKQAPLATVRLIRPDTVILTMEAPDLARNAQPGQFVMLSCDCFLPRPIGIMAADPQGGLVDLGIQVKGEGTRQLAALTRGSSLSFLGPLGRGFRLQGFERVITVAGGTGVFPLYFVQQHSARAGVEAYALCGFRSPDHSLLHEAHQALGCQTCFASESGGLDLHGTVADALAALLSRLPKGPPTLVLTCGPRPMMQAVASLATAHGLACQVSLEERMACGIGVCMGCACETRHEQPADRYKRCCVEGPVFDSEDVIW